MSVTCHELVPGAAAPAITRLGEDLENATDLPANISVE